MPASCRVRRSNTISSPYAALPDAWGPQSGGLSPPLPGAPSRPHLAVETASPTTTRRSTRRRASVATGSRPRSRTLTSLFTNESQAERSPSPRLREISPVSSRGQPFGPPDTRDAPRRPGIGHVTGHLTSRRSQLPLNAADRPSSLHPGEVTARGSQVDIMMPDESDQPGLVGSALSQSLLDENFHHDDEIVEHLEVIDPQVAAVSHLSNAANSILIPPMSSLYSRKPVIHLFRSHGATPQDILEKGGRENMDELDFHVEHVLRKRDKVRRTAAGVWSFVKTPMGIITAIYGFCVVFWGAAIIFFLAGWVPTGSADRKGFWVEVSSQVENALFTVTGIGLIPWRAVDTYRILRIWNYKRVTTKLRAKAGLPELYDEDDLPDPVFDPNYVHVLTDAQQKDLHHQQKQFAKSQTWYRPHGTETHRAFPIWTALLICLFVDGNSVFQAILCGCMWGLDRFQRPAWTTGTLIPASFMCGIVAAILIWRGGQKTKRTKVVEARLRAALVDEHRTGIPAAIVTIPGGSSIKPRNNGAPTSTKRESESLEDHVEEMVIPEVPEASSSQTS